MLYMFLTRRGAAQQHWLREVGVWPTQQWGYDGDPDSDCGGVDRAGLLNDLPCNWKLPFFCEQQLWDVPETSPQ
ncbi:hypothetical protein PR048_004129 [Dryococelus australis]|uniref:C-type lectin domain-containing protein n=1 Tax=Dryococelus australis TaxID=614101 RepID=A0ABQ9I4P3_9NEOP|nr:hypothetical protein PR048_004129 [Dryococelus australis]